MTAAPRTIRPLFLGFAATLVSSMFGFTAPSLAAPGDSPAVHAWPAENIHADAFLRLEPLGDDLSGQVRIITAPDGRLTLDARLASGPERSNPIEGRVRLVARPGALAMEELFNSPVLSLYRASDRLLLLERVATGQPVSTLRVRDLTSNLVLLELDVPAVDLAAFGEDALDHAAMIFAEGMRGGICEPSLIDCLNAAKEACEHGVATFSYSCDGETLEVVCSFTCREPAPQ